MTKNSFRNHVFPIIILFFFCLVQFSSFFNSSWPVTHDGINHAIRIREYFREIKNGQFPVRWADTLDYQYGIPLFTYVYQGPYILSSIPMALSFDEVTSYKIVLFFGYILGIFGIYAIYAKKNKFFACAAAILFGLTPYLFLDMFVRGALGEIIAIGCMPWVIYAMENNKHSLAILSLWFIIISHNFLGVIFLCFLLMYLIWKSHITKALFRDIALSIGLSAFFIIPMMLENNYIASGLNNGFSYEYQNHFLYPFQLLYGKWGYGYSIPGPGDGMSFQIGITNLLIITGAFCSLFFIKNKKNILFLLVIIVCSLFLTLTYSKFIWDTVPILQIIQFPWRLLFIPTLLCPLLFAEWILNIPKVTTTQKYIFTIVFITLAAINTRNYRRATEYVSMETYQGKIIADEQKTTTVARNEVSPIWSPVPKSQGNRVIDTKKGSTIPITIKPESVTFTIDSENQQITILKNYFPGWKLTNITDSKNIPIQPDPDGNITVSLPKGTYTYMYGQTAIERYANIISIGSFFIFLGILFRPFLKNIIAALMHPHARDSGRKKK